ncbi:MAG: AzlD domain-containing protein [Cyanobacteriota bacterium]|nr:AzlD domain-containing protein [Cyanobacteriota bacterium]
MPSLVWRDIFLVLGMALITFGIRTIPLLLSHRLELPQFLLKALNYVPPAILIAIIVPMVLIRQEGSHFSIDLASSQGRLMGTLVASLVAWKTQNLILTIGLGMVSFWLWQGLLKL